MNLLLARVAALAVCAATVPPATAGPLLPPEGYVGPLRDIQFTCPPDAFFTPAVDVLQDPHLPRGCSPVLPELPDTEATFAQPVLPGQVALSELLLALALVGVFAVGTLQRLRASASPRRRRQRPNRPMAAI